MGLVIPEVLESLGHLSGLTLMTKLFHQDRPSYLVGQEDQKDLVNLENLDCLGIHVLPLFHCIRGYLEVLVAHPALATQEVLVFPEILADLEVL